jgi:hypothetical protein
MCAYGIDSELGETCGVAGGSSKGRPAGGSDQRMF